MSDKITEAILNNSASFGKFNAILFFKAPQTYFDIIYKDVFSLFQPSEIDNSLFDLKSMEMRKINISEIPTSYHNLIVKIIFSKKLEKIILEYYEGQFIMEHIFKSENMKIMEGSNIIKKYHCQNNNSILSIGYELSISIDSYDKSLEENVNDDSLHPIFVTKNINGQYEVNKYISDNSNVNEQKVKLIQEYLRLTGIP